MDEVLNGSKSPRVATAPDNGLADDLLRAAGTYTGAVPSTL
jgi:hypothetical protein